MTCSKCGSENMQWSTVQVDFIPTDVLDCRDCKHREESQDWQLPNLPVFVGRCINCGSRREQGVCIGCGLSESDDVQVHEELRDLVEQTEFLGASEVCLRQGRLLLALKMATASANLDPIDIADYARALRVYLLRAIGEGEAALEDAKTWATEDSPAIAWASLGNEFEQSAFEAGAADAYEKAFRMDHQYSEAQARRISILLDLEREGQAKEALLYLLENTDRLEKTSLVRALDAAEALCVYYEHLKSHGEIATLLDALGARVQQRGTLLVYRAKENARKKKAKAAHRDLREAIKLLPNREAELKELAATFPIENIPLFRW